MSSTYLCTKQSTFRSSISAKKHRGPNHEPYVLGSQCSSFNAFNYSGHYSLTFLPWSIICERRSVVHVGCLQCELTVPCRCHLQSPFILPERLVDCIPRHANATVLHTVNLAVLQHFLQDSDLGSLLGNTLLHQPLPVSLPSFDIFRSTLSSQWASDHHLSYDLHRAVNATKQQETVFHSLAETRWRDSQILEVDSFTASLRSFSDGYITWTFISVPLVICALLGVLFLFYRVRVLTATVTAAHFTLHKVAALEPTLPSFLTYFSNLPPANVSTPTSSTLLYLLP